MPASTDSTSMPATCAPTACACSGSLEGRWVWCEGMAPSTLLARPHEQHEPHAHQHEPGEIPRQVVRKEGHPVSDLVKPQHLVNDDPVEHLKPTEAQEESGPRPRPFQLAALAEREQSEESRDDRDELRGVQKPIGQEPHGERRSIVEVMPTQHL